VTSALSGSDKLPGIVFTNNYPRHIEICAGFSLLGTGTSGQALTSRLYDGSISTAEADFTQNNANYRQSQVLCGITKILAAGVSTVKVQTQSASGSANIARERADRAIDWMIKASPLPGYIY
jgi:hypothetical protein